MMSRLIPIILTLMLATQSARAGQRTISYGSDFVIHEFTTMPPPRRLMPIAGENDELSFRLKVFLNFDGEELKAGGNDSKTNKTTLITAPTFDYPAMNWDRFGGQKTGIKEVLSELKLLFGSYAIDFVTERPAAGDYTMAMVGGRGGGVITGGDAVGVSPLDCNNTDRNDIVLIFGELLDTTKQLAFVIAHELGHSFGLEHVADPKGIMHPQLRSETCCWVSSDLSEAGTCGRQSQDANQVLLDNIGPGTGDTIAPLVWIVTPGSSATMPPNFTFEAAAADDLRVHHVTLYVDGKKQASLMRPPFVVALRGLSDGEHVLKAEVYDWKPNLTSVELTITVDAKCPAEGSCFVGSKAIGSACSAAGDCSSGLCATHGDADSEGVCAIACLGEGGSCPDETTCQQLDGNDDDWVCVAKGDGWTLQKAGSSDGGCSVGAQRELDLLVVLLLLGLIVGVACRLDRR